MKTKEDLAIKLGVSQKTLNFHAFVLKESERYYSFEISKRIKGVRKIHAPILPLKRIQKRLGQLLQEEYEKIAPKCVYGFRPNLNNIRNAEAHLNKRVVIKIDLKDYFTSITGGMIVNTLTSHPFNFSKEVSRTIARLCTISGHLPQGSPASPVIANIVTRTLDIKLIGFAHRTRATYTRYADDLTFSYSHEVSAKQCAIYSDSNIILNEDIISLIESKGFLINKAKIRYKKRTSRQLVTGIITNNKKVNVPREYVRETKLLIHIANKYGEEEAKRAFIQSHNTNKYDYTKNFNIKYVIRGRLEYIKSVKGSLDDVYLGLAREYSKLDPKYVVAEGKIDRTNTGEIIIFCEGKTDYKHIELALSHFKSKGHYANLELNLIDKGIEGWDKLKKKVDSLVGMKFSNKNVALFDADVIELLRVYPKETCTLISDNLFVVVIPSPPHRSADENFCIEMLYDKADLERRDTENRRIYLSSEFNPVNGRHYSEEVNTAPFENSKKLVIDSKVFNLNSLSDDVKSVNLSKENFAMLMAENADTVNFSGFRALLDRLHEISLGKIV